MLRKLKKHHVAPRNHREAMSKRNGSLPKLNQLNGNELKIAANYHYREKGDSAPSTSNQLTYRIRNTKYRSALTVDECLHTIGVDDEKLVGMETCPSEESFVGATRTESSEKEVEQAAKAFEATKAKFQKEKEKFLKLQNDLRLITDRLFNGDQDAFDDSQLKLLKDLKVHVALKSTVGDESVPATIVKLREMISVMCDRPFSDLATYLTFKGCNRDDVLQSLCSV